MKSPEGGLTADPVAGMVNGEWGFKNVDTSELTHAIHPYPARMVPQVARKGLETYATEDTLVWDPFGGSGTGLLEAMTRRNASIGTDLNPFARLLARAQTSPVPLQASLNSTAVPVQRLRGPRSHRAPPE